MCSRDVATLKRARRELREHYLSDGDDNAANAWYGLFADEPMFERLSNASVESADDAVADIVESALWSARRATRGSGT